MQSAAEYDLTMQESVSSGINVAIFQHAVSLWTTSTAHSSFS